MASESVEESQFAAVYDAMEELEVTETDAALLRNLLEESEGEDKVDCAEGGVGDDQKVVIDGHDCFKLFETHINEFDTWLGTMEMAPPLPGDGAMDWYAETSMDEMVGMMDFGDYLQVCNGVFFDEMPYSCLWQD